MKGKGCGSTKEKQTSIPRLQSCEERNRLFQTKDIQVQKAQNKREHFMFKELKQFNMAREQSEGAVLREQATR